MYALFSIILILTMKFQVKVTYIQILQILQQNCYLMFSKARISVVWCILCLVKCIHFSLIKWFMYVFLSQYKWASFMQIKQSVVFAQQISSCCCLFKVEYITCWMARSVRQIISLMLDTVRYWSKVLSDTSPQPPALTLKSRSWS